MADEILLTFNAGFSTVKFGVFRLEPAGPSRIGKGAIDFQQHPLTFHLTLIAFVCEAISSPVAAVPLMAAAAFQRFPS